MGLVSHLILQKCPTQNFNMVSIRNTSTHDNCAFVKLHNGVCNMLGSEKFYRFLVETANPCLDPECTLSSWSLVIEGFFFPQLSSKSDRGLTLSSDGLISTRVRLSLLSAVSPAADARGISQRCHHWHPNHIKSESPPPALTRKEGLESPDGLTALIWLTKWQSPMY